jgi:hypothetical protein
LRGRGDEGRHPGYQLPALSPVGRAVPDVRRRIDELVHRSVRARARPGRLKNI